MNASDLLSGDRGWLKEQPNMDPYPEGCGILLRHMRVWVGRYTRRLCAAPVPSGEQAWDGYEQRSWRCWRFHWQPDLCGRTRAKEQPAKPRVRFVDGTRVAIELVNGAHGSNLVRDVMLAEAVTQADPSAAQIMYDEYAARLQDVAHKTSSRFGEEAWANVLGECFRAKGQRGRLAAYAGHRPLASYLATVVIHEVHRLMKKARRMITGTGAEQEDADPAEGSASAGVADGDGAWSDCDRLLCDILAVAISRLMKERSVKKPRTKKLLTERQCLVLYLYVIEEWTFEQIGGLLGIHKANAQRQYKGAIRRLGAAVQDVAREREQEQSVDQCVRHVFGDLRGSSLSELIVRQLRRLCQRREKGQGGADEHEPR